MRFTRRLHFYDTQLIITTGTSGSGGKGLISNVTGATPFFVNTSNPRNISLTAGQCQNVTMGVNATGTVGASYEFFAFANQTSNPSNSALTDTLNITIGAPSGGGNASYPQLLANYTFTSSNEGFNLGTGWNWDSTNGLLTYNGSDFGGNLYTPNLGLSAYTNGMNVTIVFTTGNITNTKLAYLSSCGSITGDKYHFERATDTTQHFKHDSGNYSNTDDYNDGTQQTTRAAANLSNNQTRACRAGGSCSNNEGIGSFTPGDCIAISTGTMNGKNTLNITTIEVWRTG